MEQARGSQAYGKSDNECQDNEVGLAAQDPRDGGSLDVGRCHELKVTCGEGLDNRLFELLGRGASRSGLAKPRGKFNHSAMRPIDFIKRRCGALILFATAAYCLVYALAFIQLYFKEHPYKVASYWIFDNVPAGSRLVGPHWDDKVPVSVAGKNPSIYIMEGRDNELPVYERDTPQMIESIVRRVSLSDYIMFPTPRTPDSIPRIPDEYPNTTALLRLLWGEKIGFNLVKTFKNRPSLLGITFNDDLADESFSVYDHPKVTVFQNVEKLSAEEILRRVKDVQRYEPLPSMNEMLLMDEGGWQPTQHLWNPDWNILGRAFVIVVALGFCSWVVLGGLFRRLPDGGLGLSVLLGTLFAGSLAWGLSVAGLVPLTQSGALTVGGAIALVAFMRTCLRTDVRTRMIEMLGKHGLYVLGAAVCGAVISAIMRSSDPGFFGIGEAVDAAYLSYLSRSLEPVPADIFQVGQALPWRMLDRFFFGWVLKLSAIDPTLAVRAVAVIVGAMLGGVLYSLVALVSRSRNIALTATLVALIPTAYVLHILRDSSTRAVVVSEEAALLQGAGLQGDLAQWVRKTIRGTPCFVAACDGDGASVMPALVGLPACENGFASSASPQEGGAAQPALCRLDEPTAAFRRMMELGIELFITPGEQVTGSEVGKRRVEAFVQHPELFFKAFDDGRYAVFVPAFSRYFPRAKDPLSS